MTTGDIGVFRDRLAQHGPQQTVQRYITSGSCVHLDENDYGELRQRVSARFGLHPTNVLVVGSAKLGFSIAPTKRWQLFNDESDIDVAIVSSHLYLSIWRQVGELLAKDPLFAWDRKSLLSRKHLQGWLRPDALPTSPGLPISNQWFEFFRQLTETGICGPYKINAGIYYDVQFLELYQEQAVRECLEGE